MLEEWFSKATHCQAGSFVTRRQTFGAADSEEEYAQVTDLLNNLLDIVRDNTQHSLYSLMSVVGDLIEAYEIERHSPHQT